MTDTIGEPTTAEEDKRRIIEDAVGAFRTEVKRDFPRDPQAEPGPALAALAAAVTVRRLTKHRRLIDGFRRSTADDRTDLDGVARLVLESTLEPGLPDEQRPLLVDRAKASWTRWQRTRANRGSSNGTGSAGYVARTTSSGSARRSGPLPRATTKVGCGS